MELVYYPRRADGGFYSSLAVMCGLGGALAYSVFSRRTSWTSLTGHTIISIFQWSAVAKHQRSTGGSLNVRGSSLPERASASANCEQGVTILDVLDTAGAKVAACLS